MNEHDIDTKFMKEVIELARAEVEKNGLPFATIIVNSENKVVGRAVNQVKHSFDITDHAELIAVRQVTTAAKITDLKGHKVYIIGHPCSMCLSALMMAKPDKIYFAASLAEKDAVLKSKDRIDLYAEIVKPFDQRVVPMEQMTILRDSALAVYKAWEQKRSVR
ncbi:MAG: nucleoside deaminase [Oligoflexales bacterium]|nr:nucleoside deaminase [Oligoflexales bacterium]